MSEFTCNTTFKCYTIGNIIKTNNNYEHTVILIVKYCYTFLNLFCKNCMINLFLGTNKVVIYSEMDQNNCMTICLKNHEHKATHFSHHFKQCSIHIT